MTTQTLVNVIETARRSARSCIVVSASVWLWASAAQAQVVVAPVATPGYWGGGQTAEGAYLQGAASVINAEGLYNVNTANAMVQYENARGVYLTNRKKAAENYFAAKELHQASQAQKRERSKHSAEAVSLAAKSSLPAPLGADTLDPATGRIAWPKTLRSSRYAAKRTELDKLFEQRAKTTGTPESLKKIQAITVEMSTLLKGDIAKVPGNDYIQARKFLDSLGFTANQS